jgi:hypothetical protein
MEKFKTAVNTGVIADYEILGDNITDINIPERENNENGGNQNE